MSQSLKKFILIHKESNNHIFANSITEADSYIKIEEIGWGPKEGYEVFEVLIELKESDRVSMDHPDFEL